MCYQEGLALKQACDKARQRNEMCAYVCMRVCLRMCLCTYKLTLPLEEGTVQGQNMERRAFHLGLDTGFRLNLQPLLLGLGAAKAQKTAQLENLHFLHCSQNPELGSEGSVAQGKQATS